MRAFVTGGFADLRQVHTWNTDFVRDSPIGQRYEALAGEIERALAFMVACGADPDEFHRVDFYSCHEALLLEYEHAMTRIDSRTEQPYDVSGHFVWIGERTRQLDGAHVELLRHIRNPIGVKLGPTTTPDDALALAERLNPDNEPGRLTFITRMGAGRIRDVLPASSRRSTPPGSQVAWVCDPMHGNTFEASSGYKTRALRRRDRGGPGLLRRAPRRSAPGPAASTSSSPATTSPSASAVARSSSRPDLGHRYESVCDPRLNRGSRWSWRSWWRRCCRSGGQASRLMTVDLRSDTLPVRPSMRAAMARAEVGDDVYGEDPTVLALEERVAELFGHEAALFTPTGSLANLLAVRSLVGVGQEVLCESSRPHRPGRDGCPRRLHGLTMRTWTHPRGRSTCRRSQGLFAPDMGPFFVSHRGGLGREHPQLRRRHGAAARGPAGAARLGRRASASGSTSTGPGSGTPTSRPASRWPSTALSPT